MRVFPLLASRDLTDGLLTVGPVAVVLAVLLRLYYGFRIRRLRQELSRLRVMVGDFSESDIENVLRDALSLEVQGDRDGALALYRLVAEKATNPENVKLANSCMERLLNQSR